MHVPTLFSNKVCSPVVVVVVVVISGALRRDQ